MGPGIGGKGIIRDDSPLPFLAVKPGLFPVPYLNPFDCLVVLIEPVNEPADHIGTAVIGFLLPDFHNADAVRHLKRRPVVFALVGVHILPALGDCAGNQAVQLRPEALVVVEVGVKLRLQLRNIGPHKAAAAGKHILGLLIHQQPEKRVRNLDIAFRPVFLELSLPVDEEDPVAPDIVVALEIPQPGSREPLPVALGIRFNEFPDFVYGQHLTTTVSR